jgi:GH24 family phage-related lysozyme (muramidase)
MNRVTRQGFATSSYVSEGGQDREAPAAAGPDLAGLWGGDGVDSVDPFEGGDGRPRPVSADQHFADLARFEGVVDHLYLDTRGYVTTGVGHMLRSPADAEKLPFVHARSGQLASREEIRAAFEQVTAMKPGRRAEAYRVPGGLVLPVEISRQLAHARVESEFLPGLRRLYPEYDSFPRPAQRALLDMAYNLGVGGLRKFTNLKAAVERQDWGAAAEECQRRTCRDERNDWTRDMFLHAAAQTRAATW